MIMDGQKCNFILLNGPYSHKSLEYKFCTRTIRKTCQKCSHWTIYEYKY